MYGAFIGDIIGSQYEFDEIKTKDFTLFSYDCDFTDDSVMTVAVASAVIRAYENGRNRNPAVTIYDRGNAEIRAEISASQRRIRRKLFKVAESGKSSAV